MTVTEPLVNLRLRLGAPPTSKGHDYASLAVDLRLTNKHLLIGGAITLGILWLVMRPARPKPALPDAEQPAGELRPVTVLPER